MTLFVTCLVDLFEPEVGVAAVRVLRAGGCAVTCPSGQTCCGQPAWNAGHAEEAAQVARTTLAALDEDGGEVVVPAGSCATMVRVFWPELFELVGDDKAAARARRLGARTREFSELVATLELPPLHLAHPRRVAYHHSCHMLRELRLEGPPLALLDRVDGCEIVDWPADAHCCGFGGLFSLKLPETSVSMADDKLSSLGEAAPDELVGSDTSCLLHLRAQRGARGPPDRHAPSCASARRRTGSGRMTRFTLGGTTLRSRTASATADERLHAALAKAVVRFGDARTRALRTLDGPDRLRAAARRVRHDVMSRLPEVLERFADGVQANGGWVHWAADAAEANACITTLARDRGVRLVVKGKSMATEETALNEALGAAGIEVVETDLGEWIIQLAHQTPSHIIAPAVHLDRYQVRDILQQVAGPGRTLDADPGHLAAFAREQLRERFLAADMGITGCNFGVAETGSIVLVENEGNGRFATTLPRIHVAVMGLERLVETWDQLDLMINLLARSGTGQHLSTYTNVITGPRRPGEADGPDELHVVILDNGRSDVLGTELQEILHCIRCGACLNVCPVYRQVGGHAYGWVYSGPVGAVLTPLLAHDHPEAAELPNASTLCGACMDACPVSIPLQDLLLALRRRNAATAGRAEQSAWAAWAATWSRPLAYRASLRSASLGRPLGRFAAMAPGLRTWSQGRTPLRPAARTFQQRWKAGEV